MWITMSPLQLAMPMFPPSIAYSIRPPAKKHSLHFKWLWLGYTAVVTAVAISAKPALYCFLVMPYVLYYVTYKQSIGQNIRDRNHHSHSLVKDFPGVKFDWKATHTDKTNAEKNEWRKNNKNKILAHKVSASKDTMQYCHSAIWHLGKSGKWFVYTVSKSCIPYSLYPHTNNKHNSRPYERVFIPSSAHHRSNITIGV